MIGDKIVRLRQLLEKTKLTAFHASDLPSLIQAQTCVADAMREDEIDRLIQKAEDHQAAKEALLHPLGRNPLRG